MLFRNKWKEEARQWKERYYARLRREQYKPKDKYHVEYNAGEKIKFILYKNGVVIYEKEWERDEICNYDHTNNN